jgi:DNA polymerase IV
LEAYLMKNVDYRIKTAFVKIKFDNFQSTTVERAWEGAQEMHFTQLLDTGLERDERKVRLLGAGVKFMDEDEASSQQLDFMGLLFEEKDR